MRDDHDDELVWQTSQEKADAVSHLFRGRPHNLIEKIEKLGFTYRVDDSEDAEDIAEERAARPKTTVQNGAGLLSGWGRYPHGKFAGSMARGDAAEQHTISFVEAIFSGRKCPTEKVDFVRTGSRRNRS